MPAQIVSRILRFVVFQVLIEGTSTLKRWVRQNAKDPYHTFSGCGIGVRRVADWRERQVRDLSWGEWKVFLVFEMHRVLCPRSGIKTERIEFLEGKHPFTRRFSQAVAWECEDAAVSRVAAKWGLSGQTVRRMDKRALLDWRKTQPRRPLRHMGVEEIFLDKGRCLTVVTDLEAGEPIWAGPERKKETLDRFFMNTFRPAPEGGTSSLCGYVANF